MPVARAIELSKNILVYILENENTFNRFLLETGIDPNEIKECVNNRAFMSGVIRFIYSIESDLVIFCKNNSIDSREIAVALHVLEGEVVEY